jgi:hypothetical protein
MNEKIDQALATATKAPVALPVIGGALFGSLTSSEVTQIAAATAAILYALIQLVTLYRGIIAARNERARFKKERGE